jgi:hypothetical protein
VAGGYCLTRVGDSRQRFPYQASADRAGHDQTNRRPLFYFTRGDLRAEVYVVRVLRNIDAIAGACEQAGPFIYVIHPNHIERMTF